MSETLKITGGNKLYGTVTPVPNKNAILAALPASLLTEKTILYKNIPNTTDVTKILELLKSLGAKIESDFKGNISISCKNINSFILDKDLAGSIRSSILFAGPLLARFGTAEIPLPGGCVLGKRSISAHLDAFTKADISADFSEDCVIFTAPKKPKKEYKIWMMEASVTATENLILYSAGVDSRFVITEAASEPHVSQLLELLISMGTEINGIRSNRLTITGNKRLVGSEFTPDPDFVDIGGLITAAALTKGKITIKNSNNYDIVGGMIQCFEKFNIGITHEGKDIKVDGSTELFIDPKNSGFPLAGENLPKLAPRPWPGFPVDVLPVMLTLASKAKGRILIQNWMYETGLDFVHQLNAMGANIFVADPQRVIVTGPADFKKSRVVSPSIIQACKAIFLAALADPVEIIIEGTHILKRRYPNIVEIYKELGADIEIVT